MHELMAEARNAHWGYFDRDLPPVITIQPGDAVHVQAVTHHAGDAPDLLMDTSVTRLFQDVVDRGPGPHILFGPIAVDGAEPGDVLEVRVRSLAPMFAYGSNLAAHWGYLYQDFSKERVTIWSIDSAGGTARAEFGFDWVTTPLVERPGTIVPADSVQREPLATDLVVPLRPHLGTMGVAPSSPGRHSSVPPGDHGGNIDNWRACAGTAMYYPVQVPGALLSLGDPHMAQGDAELSGTAIEASLDVVIEVHLHKGLPVHVPVLETDTYWYVHGFGDSLDEAMRATARRVIDLLRDNWGITRDDAYSFTSAGVDFTVTQVVDQRLGIHAGIPKLALPGVALA